MKAWSRWLWLPALALMPLWLAACGAGQGATPLAAAPTGSPVGGLTGAPAGAPTAAPTATTAPATEAAAPTLAPPTAVPTSAGPASSASASTGPTATVQPAGPTATALPDPAVTAILAYLEARARADVATVTNLSCKTWRPRAVTEAVSFRSMNAKLVAVTCQVNGSAGSFTLVGCGGKMVTTYGGESRDWDLSAFVYQVSAEEGQWKMCGYH